ncbi:hypothetical protein OPQ81_010839 [Rhizoctonia solani]|nr:hypothetical protein OPQ81_010839 [Rhizoctonia solani]
MYRISVGHRELTSTHRNARKHWTGFNRDKYEAAEETVAAFKRAGTDCCIFGSLGFKLLGVGCKPNDVDIIVLDTKKSLENLKEYLVKEHSQSRFYLVPSRNRKAKYRVLWYATRRGARVKVDILQPGEMSIPRFQATRISQKIPPGRAGHGFNLPVAPVELVLLLKLQGWDVHYKSHMPHLRKKEHEDVKQIRALLIKYKYQFDFDYLPKKFMDMAEAQVQEYVLKYPPSIGSWRKLTLYH